MSETDKPDRTVLVIVRLEVPGQAASYWEVPPFPLSRTGDVFGRIFAALEDRHSVRLRMLNPADKPADDPAERGIGIEKEIEISDDGEGGS